MASASFGLLLASTALAAPQQLEALPVTGPSPFVYTWILDLSNEGHAVGYASAAAPALDPARAYLWTARNAPAPAIDLGDFGAGWPYATAEGVNDAGTVVGWAQVGPGSYRGFVWRSPGPMVQLSGFARAIDVDSGGRVLGLLLGGGGAIWENGAYTSLPALPGGHVFVPAAMNDAGQVVGRGISTQDGRQHAFVYDATAGAYVDLGMAPGDDWDSEAVAISENGRILGMSRRLGPTAITSRMVTWEPNAGWTMAHIVDPLPGDDQLIMTDINDAGDAVGMSGWPQVPVLWRDGRLVDVNTMLAPGQNATFFIATSINDHGWIAVDGQFGCCGYVLRPLPGTGTAYCFGDGSGAPCPCGNAGSPGHGCGNGTFAGGSQLTGLGDASVGADTLVLSASGSTPGAPGLFFQGDDALSGGNGLAFGDGLRCAGVNAVRLQLLQADGSGAASSSVPIAAQGGAVAGAVLRYQWWYRDPTLSPCQGLFNLSNGLEVTWSP